MYYKEPKKRGGFSYIIVAIIAALIGGILSPYISNNFLYGKILPNPNTSETTVMEGKGNSGGNITINPNEDINTVSAVAEKVMDSVVGVTTVELKQDVFRRLYTAEGVGSGIVIDANGYILTNSHVVGDGSAKEINVLFQDGQEYPAELLWNDATLDLAIVKVDAKNLSVAELGDSDELKVGELSIAIGNPLGLDFQRTVTAGVVSGLNRSIQVSENVIMEDLIQTDASINHGNSGGPLLNSKGEVIGINTIKIGSDQAEGLGFAIPINQAKKIITSIIETGKFEPIQLGIRGLGVSEYQRLVGVELPVDNGIVVVEVEQGYVAAESGMNKGDIITHVDGEEIKTFSQLKHKLYEFEEGDKSEFTIIRDMKEMKIEVVF